MSETQQQAAAPSLGGNIANMGKGWDSPFSKVDGKYNLAGALLVGGGSGLITWALGRLLGLKGGASLGASILAGLGGIHGALAMQNGKGFFNIDHWRELMNMNRANGGGQPSPEDNMSREDDQNGVMSLKEESPFWQNLAGEPPANLDVQEIEAGKTKSLLADKGKSEYLNMIQNGMVAPEAHLRAIENGIRSNPGDPYVQKLIDAYANRKDIDNADAQARWVAVFNNKRQAAINSYDPGAVEDANFMRPQQEALLARQKAYYQAVDANNRAAATDNSPASYTGPRQGYGQYDADAMMGNYPQISPREAAMNASMRNAREAMAKQQEAMRNALRSSDIIQQRRQRLHEQDMADVARRTDEIKKQQAMDASMNSARKQMAMTDAMNRAKRMVPPASNPMQ